MPILYIKEQRTVLRQRGGRLRLEQDSHPLLDLPLRDIEAVAVFGNVQVTTQALGALLDRGIPLVLYSRHGRLKGYLQPPLSHNVPLRLAQYSVSSDPAASLPLARRWIAAKLENAAALVHAYSANYPSPRLHAAGQSLETAAVQARGAASLDSLLGFEGAAAAAYFEAFREMNRSGLPFDARRRRPATDPINALLSFGYTLVLQELRVLVEAAGLDPHLGFLHRPSYGRPSAALDLLEPFRAPVVDRLTLRLVNERILKPEDFGQRLTPGPQSGAVVLLPEALTRYLTEYEALMSGPRTDAPRGYRESLKEAVADLLNTLKSVQGEQHSDPDESPDM